MLVQVNNYAVKSYVFPHCINKIERLAQRQEYSSYLSPYLHWVGQLSKKLPIGKSKIWTTSWIKVTYCMNT